MLQENTNLSQFQAHLQVIQDDYTRMSRECNWKYAMSKNIMKPFHLYTFVNEYKATKIIYDESQNRIVITELLISDINEIVDLQKKLK